MEFQQNISWYLQNDTSLEGLWYKASRWKWHTPLFTVHKNCFILEKCSESQGQNTSHRMLYQTLIPICWRIIELRLWYMYNGFCHSQHLYQCNPYDVFFIMLVHLVQEHHQPAAPSSVIDHKEQSAACARNKS